jgi:putative phosphoribosyl transferase
MKFLDRADAGRRLAGKLAHLNDRQPVVLALPRGGVAVGFEIAQALNAPLDIVLVRKIGVPWQPELALGAVTDGASPEIFIDRDMAAVLDIPESYVQEATVRQLDEIERRRRTYCAGRPPLEITGRTAIVVDDGIATGATMQGAPGPRRPCGTAGDPRRIRQRSRRDDLSGHACRTRSDWALLSRFPSHERRRGD